MKILSIYTKIKISHFVWLGFTGIFLLAGVIGHDPWKQDETYSFGIIYHFYTAHSWLVPKNAGVPFMEKPPLYYWTAVIFCKIFGGLLPLHDSARLASFFYMAVAAIFLWKAAKIIFRNSPQDEKMEWVALAFFLGTLGIVRHAHDMFTDVALLAGSTIALYGMVLLTCVNDSWKKAGVWFGIGIGVAFLSKGLFIPVILGLGAVFLLIILKEIRTRDTMRALVVAVFVAAPFLLIWPICLYNYSYPLFMQWFWENNVGRFLGFSVARLGAGNQPGYIAYSAFWFAFPVFPLALFSAIRQKSQWQEPEYALPVAMVGTGLAFLLISASARALYLLPLIPMFTLLATRGAADIPGKFLVFWNMAARFCYLIAIVAIWVIWLALQKAHPLPRLLPSIASVLPVDFVPSYTQWGAVAVSIAATLFFLASLRLDGGTKAGTAGIWFSGIATVWITTSTLLLPWINETKSYRPVLAQMNSYIKHSSYSNDCMNTCNLGESIAPMLEYFSDGHALNTVQSFSDAHCPLILTVTGKAEAEDSRMGWTLVWKGSRVLDAKDEELRLYARQQ